METSLLDQGVTLMLVGMGTVFTFLTVLVLAMSTMSAAIVRMLPTAVDDDVSEEEIAAIAAAITLHRNRK